AHGGTGQEAHLDGLSMNQLGELLFDAVLYSASIIRVISATACFVLEILLHGAHGALADRMPASVVEADFGTHHRELALVRQATRSAVERKARDRRNTGGRDQISTGHLHSHLHFAVKRWSRKPAPTSARSSCPAGSTAC